MHPICNKAKVILQEMWQINSLFVLNTKCYVLLDLPQTLLITTLHIFKHSDGCIMLVIV